MFKYILGQLDVLRDELILAEDADVELSDEDLNCSMTNCGYDLTWF